MYKVQLSNYIREKINSIEGRIRGTTDTNLLWIYSDFVNILKSIDKNLFTLVRPRDERGHRLVQVKAHSQREALAALNIAREYIEKRYEDDGESFEIDVFLTKDGSVWGG